MSNDAQTLPSLAHHYTHRTSGTAAALVYDNPKDGPQDPPSAIAFGGRDALERLLPSYRPDPRRCPTDRYPSESDETFAERCHSLGSVAPSDFPNVRVVDVPCVWTVRDGKAHVTHDLTALIPKAAS